MHKYNFQLIIACFQQLNGPKAPPPDMFFIPNGNQPDFGYLVGLDLVVQRVLKDKQVFAYVIYTFFLNKSRWI